MPIERPQYFIILFRVNQVFTFYHFITPRFSNQSDNVGYCTFASQVIRYTRICNNIDGVRVRILFLFNLFVSLGFDPCKLIKSKTFTNCINRHKFSEKFKTIGHILSPTSI